MSEELEVSTQLDAGVSTEEVASQEPLQTGQPAAEGQASEQASGVKPPVEPPASQPSSNGTQRRLPSSFYNARKFDAVGSRMDSIERTQQQILQALQKFNNPSTPPAPNPKPQTATDDPEEKWWAKPYSATRSLVSEEMQKTRDELKAEVLGEFRKEEQEKQFDKSLQEADRLVLTNERAKTNPNFNDDIIAIFKKYKGLQTLAKADPVAAANEAFELYDVLIKGGVPNVPVPKKGQMASTQTAVRANGANTEEALLVELKQITDSLTPLNASDPVTVKRMEEINLALDQLNA